MLVLGNYEVVVVCRILYSSFHCVLFGCQGDGVRCFDGFVFGFVFVFVVFGNRRIGICSVWDPSLITQT